MKSGSTRADFEQSAAVATYISSAYLPASYTAKRVRRTLFAGETRNADFCPSRLPYVGSKCTRKAILERSGLGVFTWEDFTWGEGVLIKRSSRGGVMGTFYVRSEFTAPPQRRIGPE